MKYRCPHCSTTFETKLAVCPRCGKVLKYKESTPKEVRPQMDQEPVIPNKKYRSHVPFNVLNFFMSVLGLGFFVFALFGPIYFKVVNNHGVNSNVDFSLFDLLLHFIQTFPEISATFTSQGLMAGLNLIFKDLFAMIDLIFIAISILIQAILVITNLIHLLSNTLPSVARSETMGNQGQLRGGWTVLVFSYLCVFIPWIFGLIYINARGNVMVLDQVAHLFMDNTWFHGLTYWHILFLSIFVLMFVLHFIRRAEQSKLRAERI